MAVNKYALEPDGPKRLEIESHLGWRNCAIKLDGSLVGTIPDLKTLKQGMDFQLPDGSSLHVQYRYSFLYAQFIVLRDGKPLPGTASDPRAQVNGAAGILYFVGGLSALIGLLSGVLQLQFFVDLGFTWLSLVMGIVFLALAFFTKRLSKFALIAAIVLYGLDGISTVVILALSGRSPVSSLFVHILFIIPMIMGVGAITTLKKQQEKTPSLA